MDFTKKKSFIWKFFQKTEAGVAKCCKCSLELKIGKSSSTSSLINHLKRHPKEYTTFSTERKTQKENASKTDNQPTIPDIFKRKEYFSTSHPRHLEITKAVTQMIACDLHSYSLVEETSFRNLLNVLEPRYCLPSRTTFSRTLVPQLYNTEKGKLKCVLEQELSSVLSLSLTTDTWTSRANDSFISLTLHYLTSNFDYRSFVLGNKNIKESHTADFLLGQLEEMVEEWELPKTPTYVVSDNGANIKAALDRSCWERVPCFAHCLQLAIHDAEADVPGVNELSKRARSIVSHYNHSSTARARLNGIQKRLGISEHELLQDVSTRWNSCYDMLERLIEQKEVVSADIAASADIENLTTIQWKLAAGIVQVLKPFKQVTTELCSEKYPTISMVAPALHVIEEYLADFIKRNTHGSGITLARALLKSIKARFPMYKQDVKYIVPMALDQRYMLKILTREETKIAKAMIKAKIELVIKEPEVQEPTGKKPCDQNEQTGLWSTFEESDEDFPDECDNFEKELDFYLQRKRISTKENPLVWWKDNANSFPNLKKGALFYLGIPATQTSSERLFSTSGLIVNSKRETMLPEHIEEICFLHGNLK